MHGSTRWLGAILCTLITAAGLHAAANISVASVASVNNVTTLAAAASATPVILAMQVTNDGDDDTVIDEIELTLEADWSNESTFDPNDAFLAVRAFVDGSAAGDSDGNGAFTFDGNSDEELGVATSTSVSIVAGSGSGNDVSDTASATITFDVNALELPAGETKAIYFTLEITDDGGDFNAAEDEVLELRLRLPSISRISTTEDADTFEPLESALAGRLVRYGASPAPTTASSTLIDGQWVADDSGCAIRPVNDGAPWGSRTALAIALSALLLRLRIGRRIGITPPWRAEARAARAMALTPHNGPCHPR